MSTGVDAIKVACPACHGLNRVPIARLQDSPVCGRCKSGLFSAHPVALDASGFERHALQAELPLLVDFWAPWCQPCLMMAPQFEAAARVLEPVFRLAKVDTEAQPDLGARFNIRSIPTLMLLRGGRELARHSGAMATADIVRWARTQLER